MPHPARMKIFLFKFWSWYERNHEANVRLVLFIFLWQLIHLYWLTTDVVLLRLTGTSLFTPTPVWQFLIILADFAEIPTLIAATVLYAHALRKKFNWKDTVMLILINSQWLHIFWITDEFVVREFASAVSTSLWLSWFAIALDYLEFPAIFDLSRQFLRQISGKKVAKV